MTLIRFRAGLHFWLKNRECEIQSRLPSGKLQIVEIETEQTSVLSEKEFVQFLFENDLELEPPTDKAKLSSYQQGDFSQFPDSLKAEAKRREPYVKAVLENQITIYTKASLTPLIEQISQTLKDEKPPSHITLYRWLKAYQRSGSDIRSLIPRHSAKGNFNPKLSPEVNQLLDEVVTEVYLTPERPTITQVYDVLICRILQENLLRKARAQKTLKIPHRTTIYRLIQNLDPYQKTVGRYGERTAKLMYHQVQDGPKPTRPLERVEIDHTLLPFFVVDTQTRIPIGTPALTSAVDKYSGVIVGYYLSFEPFSSVSVMYCLLHAIQPKNYLSTKFPGVQNTWDAYGVMETLVVDNGKEFYSQHFQDACKQLGITVQYTPPRMPWYKSIVERTFGSYNTQLLKGQPGGLFKEWIPDNYDPQKNAVVSLSALQEMIHIFIVDIHNQSAHPSFKTPRAEVWSKGLAEYPTLLPTRTQDLRILVGAIDYRVITRRGIEFLGLYYHSPVLARLRSNLEKPDARRKSGCQQREKATIKYDPTDLSQIYVFDPASHEFISVPAVNQEYTKGLTLWQHRVIKNLAAVEAKKVDIEALALAKQKIQEIVEREWLQSKAGKSRKSMARWLGIGRDDFPETDYTIVPDQSVNCIDNSSNQDVDNLFNQTHSLAGVSKLDSALNASEILADSPSQSPVLLATDTASNKSPNSKNKRHQKQTANKSQPVSTSLPLENTDVSSDWQPDLTGWSVSIGLPK